VLVPQTTLVAGENGLGEEASVALVLPGGNLGLSGGGLLGLGGFGGLGSLLGLGGLGRSSGLGLCVGHGLPVDDRGINISHGNSPRSLRRLIIWVGHLRDRGLFYQ